MTVNQQITAQTIGTSTNVGEDKFPQKVTLGATTTSYAINAKVTNGAGAYDTANKIRIWYVTSPISVLAAAAPSLLRGTARCLDITPAPGAAVARSYNTALEYALGLYLYYWCDIPNATVAQSLDVYTTELP